MNWSTGTGTGVNTGTGTRVVLYRFGNTGTGKSWAIMPLGVRIGALIINVDFSGA